MKILFSTYTVAFQNPGGGEQVLTALRSALIRRGHQVSLFNAWNDSLRDFDVIHYFSCIENSFWELAKTQVPKTPLIVTPTFFRPDSFLGSIRGVAKKWRSKASRTLGFEPSVDDRFSLPDIWLPTTELEKRSLHSYFPLRRDSKTFVIPNGVDPCFEAGLPGLFRTTTKTEGPFVLNVARFHPVKNHLRLIEAIRICQTHAVFIGAPDMGQKNYFETCQRAMREAEASDPTGKTKFTVLSGISHDDPLLASAYSAATVFALPSVFETFGIAAIEAAVAGTPIVATRNLGCATWLPLNSRYVNPRDVSEIAQKIKNALLEPKRNPPAERNALLRELSWDAIAAKVEEIYLQKLL